MQHRKLLLLSNSKNYGHGYLEHAEHAITDFLPPEVGEILFVPFAAVRISFDEYTALVRDRFRTLGYTVSSVHEAADAHAAVRGAQAIAVGGGNTFHLLHALHEFDLLEPIRESARSGTPYIGWSAGSNIVCPTIRTTNDMPIVEPPSFEALGLVPFQINPHYTEAQIPQHAGETRAERLLEFVEENPGIYAVGLPEGGILLVEAGTLALSGAKPARIFMSDSDPFDIEPGGALDFLLG
jgi:dipeptidase E